MDDSSESINENVLRDKSIRQLVEIIRLAYEQATDQGTDIASREVWIQRHTNATLALNLLLKDSQVKKYEERMRLIEEYTRRKRVA